jgi:hypothetical protein
MELSQADVHSDISRCLLGNMHVQTTAVFGEASFHFCFT